jgi:hypothetical protein
VAVLLALRGKFVAFFTAFPPYLPEYAEIGQIVN